MYNPYDNNQQESGNGFNPNTGANNQNQNNFQSDNETGFNPYTGEPNPRLTENPTNWHVPNNATEESSYQVDFHAAAPAVKKERKALKVAAILLACAIISTACGLGGTMIAQQINGGTGNGGKTSVLTQSIVNTSNTAGSTSTVAQIAAATASSVVEITTESASMNEFLQQYVSEGAGSGVIISEDGYIITNNHVIAGASKIQVRTKDGESYEATLVGTDAESDIAVLKIKATGLKPVVFADSDKITVGEQAVAIGNPLGSLGGTVTEGIISALDREITIEGTTMHLLQTSAAINPGNSGGGLFNSSGELVGVVNAKTSASGIEGLGFAIPANTAKKISEDLIANGYVTGKVRMGVSLIKIADEQTAMQYRVSEVGVYIAKVEANSDAYYGGLKSGDLIKSINGKEVKETTDVQDVIAEGAVGDEITFGIARNGKDETVVITLTEYNSSLSVFNG